MKRWMLGSAMVAMAVRMAAAEAGAAIGVPGGAATESSPQAAAQAVSPGSGALAGPARAFSLMSYRLTPYSEPQLVLGFNGDPQDSVISEASPPNEFSSQELGNARIAGSLAYSRQVTALDQDSAVSVPLQLSWIWNRNRTLGQNWSAASYFETEDLQTNETSDVGMHLSPAVSQAWYSGPWQAGWQGQLSLSGDYREQAGQIQQWNYDPAGMQAGAWQNNYVNQQHWQAAAHVEARWGLGRRVETRWAWDALEIERALREHGSLIRPLDDGELQELAGLLAAIGSEYAWDQRDQRLHDTRLLKDFLLSRGCISATDSDAVVILSDADLLPASPRLRGWEALAVAEVDDVASIDDRYSSLSSNSPPSSSDGYTEWMWGNAAPGAAVVLDWSRPLGRDGQWDVSERLDYQPYRCWMDGPQLERREQSFSDALGLGLGWFPSQRFNLTLSESLKFDAASVDHWDGIGYGTWLEGYADRQWNNVLGLSLNCQMTYFLVASLTASWTYGVEWRQAADYSGWMGAASPGPGTDAFNAYYGGQPYSTYSYPSLSIAATYRVF